MEKKDRAPWRPTWIGLSIVFGLMAFWCLVDIYGPWHGDLRKFDPSAIARTETLMWRAYYDKDGGRLFLETYRLLRTQEGFPPIRALASAYWAGRAAFIFKEGKTRSDYVRALPYLESYYGAVCRTGQLKADPTKLAQLELDWWIIHRERGEHGESALVRAIASVAGELYQLDPNHLTAYALPRARAMLERSEKEQAKRMTDNDWLDVQDELAKSYGSLAILIDDSHDKMKP